MKVPNCSRCKYETFVTIPAPHLHGEYVVCGNCGQAVGFVPDVADFKQIIERLEAKIDMLSKK